MPQLHNAPGLADEPEIMDNIVAVGKLWGLEALLHMSDIRKCYLT